jgi:hypothetical protein
MLPSCLDVEVAIMAQAYSGGCGIQSFAVGTNPKTGDKMAAINVRCVDGVDVDALKIKKVDGRSF